LDWRKLEADVVGGDLGDGHFTPAILDQFDTKQVSIQCAGRPGVDSGPAFQPGKCGVDVEIAIFEIDQLQD
jgi:hypothetical protein